MKTAGSAIVTLRQIKSIWRDQLCADNRLRPAAFKIGYVMADYITLEDSADIYRRTGRIVIWPSQQSIREKTEFSPDTVRASVAQLIERGHMRKTKRGNQFTGSNTYRIIVQEQPR